ncbi:immunoglobulin domain-containing protein [Pinibacter aurantiacus]|uniref:Immunoglobulin domain-containing protein n=1 Tax=Pinibacter aurantiacus TaxID=2851599 RepID=A0A9E2SFF5_9BACT|nr:immunoglobulin domain-containing protein [Pinibacter aurantiacus]MBV4360050.1 immunoglobulin domain-containing protein [Pinibacter aurantiacus]
MRKSNLKQGFLLPAIMLVMGILSVFIADAQLTVKANPSFSVQEADPITTNLSVTASGGTTPYTYQWKKKGVVTTLSTTSSIRINVVAFSDSGSYTCVVTDKAGNTLESSPIYVTVTMPATAPVFVSAIADITVAEAAKLQFLTRAAFWAPRGVCKWYKEDGTPVTGGVEGYNTAGAAVGPYYTYDQAKTSMSGNYYCTMTNGMGVTKSNVFKVTVNPATATPVINYLNSALSSYKDSTMYRVTFLEGSISTSDYLNVTATGYTTIQWKKDGQPIATPSSTPTRFAVQDQPGRSWQGSDAGTYTVDLTNSVGTTTSVPIIVTIAPSVKPKLIAHTADTTVTEADTIALYGVASGVAVNYTWARLLADGTIRSITNQKNTYSTYMSIADTGTYYCIAYNTAGSDTAAIRVTMKRTQPLPIFLDLKDQYEQGGSNLVSVRLIGELSETLTLCYIDGTAATRGTLQLYSLGVPGGSGTLPVGKHTIRFTNADATLVLEKTFELK